MVILFLIAATLSFSDAHAGEDKINIFVSILPQKYFAERIAGDRINVHVMVGPGRNPVTYEPTPRQMVALQHSRLFFRIGVPFETVWIKQIAELNPNIEIIDCCEEIKKLYLPEFDHSHDLLDPHTWTSPSNAKLIASRIKNALVETDPSLAADYEVNYLKLIADLEQLDSDISKLLGTLKHRLMVVSHPSWGYFAKDYDLEQISIEQAGTEIRAKTLGRLIERLKQTSTRFVFVQKQFNTDGAYVLAGAIGAEVVELDPLAEDYINNLMQVTRAIAAGE